MTEDTSYGAIILAAGKGTRMKSRLPKVMHCLLGVPMLRHVMEAVKDAGIPYPRQVVVAGHGGQMVENYSAGLGVKLVYQKEQLGTGHAVLTARDIFKDQRCQILIICGDTPLFRKDTLEGFIEAHKSSDAGVSILSALFSDPTGYGRILRDENGNLLSIVEEKDASPEVRAIREVNTGTYLVRSDLIFDLLEQVDSDNAQGEYYLTDVVEIALKAGIKVHAFDLADEEEALGVNSRAQLSLAEGIMLDRIRAFHMGNGVTISMAHTVYIEPSVAIEPDVTIGPYTVLKGKTRIHGGAIIGPYSFLEDFDCASDTILAPYTIKTPDEKKFGPCY